MVVFVGGGVVGVEFVVVILCLLLRLLLLIVLAVVVCFVFGALMCFNLFAVVFEFDCAVASHCVASRCAIVCFCFCVMLCVVV